MTHMSGKIIAITAAAAFLLSGCKTAGKVVTAPFKGAYEVGKATGKGVYTVGKTTGQVAYGTGKVAVGAGKLAGEGVYTVGKGVYYVGSVPVKITDAAMDTTERMLRMTTTFVDLAGKTATVTRDIQAVHLDNELAKVKTAKNILGVLVDIVR